MACPAGMTDEPLILVNVSVPEARIALMEEGRVQTVSFCDHFGNRPVDYSGSVVLGRVRSVAPALSGAFVDVGLAEDAFLRLGRKSPKRHEGECVLLQIRANPAGGKGALVSDDISVAGRYVVLKPYSEAVTVSEKISDQEERLRLGSIRPSRGGAIWRTEAEEVPCAALLQELRWLEKRWGGVCSQAADATPPRVVHDGSAPVERLRDVWLQCPAARIVCDDAALLSECRKAKAFEPDTEFEIYTKIDPLFSAFGIEDQIAEALPNRVSLPSGGWIAIEQTEALTAVDVNSGRSWAPSRRDVAVRTNAEAVQLLAQQLRLRNIGGIVVIDLMKMEQEKDRVQIVAALRQAMNTDPVPHRIGRVSAMGLLELTRQRRGLTLADQLGIEACARQNASGVHSIGYEMCRALQHAAKVNRSSVIEVRVADDLEAWLNGPGAPVLQRTQETLPFSLKLARSSHRSIQAFEIIQ